MTPIINDPLTIIYHDYKKELNKKRLCDIHFSKTETIRKIQISFLLPDF